MLKFILELDKALFLFLNGKHTAFWDVVMYWASDRFIWVPLYGLLIGFLFWKQGKQAWLSTLALVLVVVLADRISSGFFKPFFERLRPCHEPSLASLIHLSAGCGGQYGFVSSHAANTFGLATFVWLLFRHKFAYIATLFGWAALVSFSRIYLGAHYPLDILCGGVLGAACALGVYQLYLRTKKQLFAPKQTAKADAHAG